MDLHNRFTVPAPIDRAWQTLLEVPRVAPCLPGATLDGQLDDATYQGRVKVKVGPIVMTYRGTVSLDSVDESARQISLTAEGRELRGAGTARATATATLNPGPGGSTDVTVVTRLDLSGKPAQFGRAVLGEVSARLIEQFAANLAATIAGPAAGPESDPAAALPGLDSPASASPVSASEPAVDRGSAPGPARPAVRRGEVLDLTGLARGSLRRAGAVAAAAFAAVLLGVVVVRTVRRR